MGNMLKMQFVLKAAEMNTVYEVTGGPRHVLQAAQVG